MNRSCATGVMNPNVREIIEQWLLKNGYDGLYNAETPCRCSMLFGGLNACGGQWEDCKAGYTHLMKDIRGTPLETRLAEEWGYAWQDDDFVVTASKDPL